MDVRHNTSLDCSGFDFYLVSQAFDWLSSPFPFLTCLIQKKETFFCSFIATASSPWLNQSTQFCLTPTLILIPITISNQALEIIYSSILRPMVMLITHHITEMPLLDHLHLTCNLETTLIMVDRLGLFGVHLAQVDSMMSLRFWRFSFEHCKYRVTRNR
jgi:hypothetical protein